MAPVIPIHPDDLLFFNEVANVMRRVAKLYELPLLSVKAMPMPTVGMADRLGDCDASGHIRLVMRATVDGKFVDAPRSPEAVWKTAAHELAHLRHLNHGRAFEEFAMELEMAVKNARVDHRQRVIDKLLKMQKSRDGEAAIGNTAAAEAFAEAINRMMIDHELEPSALDYASALADDPVIELGVNFSTYSVPEKRARIAWQASLARIVANAHLCKYLIRQGSNDIWFVGTRSHATVAEYVFGTLVRSAAVMSKQAYRAYRREAKALYGKKMVRQAGFRESWLAAFIERIEERLKEARKAAVASVPTEERGTALMRLDGALVKAQRYIDDKFTSKRRVASLGALRHGNRDGLARGRAAADAMPIGRRGVTGGSSVKGYIS